MKKKIILQKEKASWHFTAKVMNGSAAYYRERARKYEFAFWMAFMGMLIVGMMGVIK